MLSLLMSFCLLAHAKGKKKKLWQLCGSQEFISSLQNTSSVSTPVLLMSGNWEMQFIQWNRHTVKRPVCDQHVHICFNTLWQWSFFETHVKCRNWLSLATDLVTSSQTLKKNQSNKMHGSYMITHLSHSLGCLTSEIWPFIWPFISPITVHFYLYCT